MSFMRILKWLILGTLLASPAAYPLAGPTVATDNVKARLVGETTAIGPGESIWVALEFDIRAGWHTYWRNPGDSGQATTIDWTLPSGLTAGPIVWAVPHRFELPPLVNYGYATHVMHLVQITAPKDLKPGASLPVVAKAGWLVCSDVCIPEEAKLQLNLPAAAAPVSPLDSAASASFAAARRELPSPAPAPAHARLVKGEWLISLGQEWGSTLSQIKSLTFIPYEEGSIDYAAPQTLTRSGKSLELHLKAGDPPPKNTGLHGVLLATEQNGSDLDSVPLEIAASADDSAVSDAAAPAGPPLSFLSLLLPAILGGLILNLMPCVFPVLSIKAIGLVEQAKKDPAAVRAKALVFAAGVIGSMLVLAGVLLALRAGGEQIGWGFQLQSPLFVTLLIYLLLAVGLNMSGVFEVGGGLAGVGDGLTQGDSYRASFFTGVLTTLVATPCSAPFMATAIGYALTQSPLVAFAIFASLGFGLSLPYLLLSFAPWTRRMLPKPGAWMETLRQIFAFPVYASAAWLLWVLAQQTTALGLGAGLAGAVLVALAAWAYQKSKLVSTRGRTAALITVGAALVLAVLLPVRFSESVAAASPTSAGDGTRNGETWQPYDAAKVAELSAAGRPLLVNFTASWCLTCLVNERNAFADDEVRKIFRSKGVTLMKGDWTNRDPAITQALSSFNRAGVPLYVVYNAKPGSTEPLVLPQLLTAGVVHDTFTQLPDRDLK